ncbi:MAG: M23 family metallopeptidase [Leptonema sp. (in: bacteria)]
MKLSKAICFISFAVLIYNGVLSNTSRLRVFLDNKYIQTYRNTTGRWILNDGKNLKALAKEYETTEKEILEINDNNIKKRFLFVPFGENFKNNLLKQDLGRRILEVEANKLLWPLENLFLTSRYGKRFDKLHTGVDFATPIGTPVLAVQNGFVKKSGWMGEYGYAVIIQHPDGKDTWYAHLSEIFLLEGENVEIGQIIGLSGSTGRSTGPHLHFEVRYENIPLNPEDFLPDAYFRNDIIIKEGSDGIVIFNHFPETNKKIPLL